MSGEPGKSGTAPVGRGASILAALQATRRPGQPGAPSESPSPIYPPTSSDPTVSAAPAGRAGALLQFAMRHQVGRGGTSPTSSELVASSGESTPCSSPSRAPPSTGRGGGMMERLRMLRATPSVSPAPSTSSEGAAVENLTEQVRKLSVHAPPQSAGPMPPHLLAPIKQVPQEEMPIVHKVGESGQPINISANYIDFLVEPGKGIFEYEVRFAPTIDSKDMRFKLLNQHRETLGPAKTFDGVTLYLPYKLADPVTHLQSSHVVTNEPVTVIILFRWKKPAHDCIHFYNVLIRKISHILGMVQMHRNYFNPNSPVFLPAEKLEVWPGFATAVAEHEGGIKLCCDVSFRVLRTTTVLDELVQMSRFAQPSKPFVQMAKEVLIGLSVLTRYNNRMYRIDDILFDKNPQATFDCQGVQTSFIDYYKKNYNIDIADKNQPMLLNQLKTKRPGREDETQLVCLIPELCYLTGLDDRIRNNFTIMKALSAHTRVAPMERVKALQSYIDSVKGNEKASNLLKMWGLTLADNLVQLGGRVLDREKIFLSRGAHLVDHRLDWTRPLATDVLVPVKIDNWIVVYVAKDESKVRDFNACLLEVGTQMGIRIAPPKNVSLPNDRTDTYVSRIREELNPSLQLVVCVFPTARDDRYSAVKVLCTAQTAIPSQMINFRTINQPGKLRSVVQKVALQINAKMGGELWAVAIPTKTLMVCGIDVYHDPTRKGQSVVGFVASINPGLTRWYSRAKTQPPGIELIDTLKVCLIESLKKYFEVNHDFPKQIVLYRDGVGDGQLQYVMEHEVAQLLDAFKAVEPPFDPKFTVVVVQKRINSRFFASTSQGSTNPPGGSIIDHTVTRRDWWDFFLVSQHVTQGTVSPTHYIVIHDGGMKPDILQKLTYKMTHMYYNWAGTIRVPAPCQYAHKLAFLIGQNVRRDPKEELCNRLYFL